MDWEAIRDNLGLVVFAAIWLLSFLMRAVRRKGGTPTAVQGPLARRRRVRRRAVLTAVVLMGLAVAAWELSRGADGEQALLLQIGAGLLVFLALIAVLVAGFSRPGGAVQGGLRMEIPEERGAEIAAGEPLEPS